MNGQTAQRENPTILAKPSSNLLNRKTFIYTAVLLLGFILGFISFSILPFGKLTSPAQVAKVTAPSPSSKPTIDESKLPISLALLTNPIVYEWRGGVKGKMTKKDEHAFTLVDEQGNSITITDIMPSGDKWEILFFDKTNKMKEASYSAIPLGSTLFGEFFVFKNGPNTAVGSMFTKQ